MTFQKVLNTSFLVLQSISFSFFNFILPLLRRKEKRVSSPQYDI